jgi:Zn-dependent peptidase ImmA (M78 family)
VANEVKNDYLAKGEKRFVELSDFLAKEDDFGVTFRLGNRELWELEFVSIIDCRGNKSVRAYFTKWHEIAHLMTQTQQMRFAFRRTHSSDQNPDEERLMDAIAGRFGFSPNLA